MTTFYINFTSQQITNVNTKMLHVKEMMMHTQIDPRMVKKK